MNQRVINKNQRSEFLSTSSATQRLRGRLTRFRQSLARCVTNSTRTQRSVESSFVRQFWRNWGRKCAACAVLRRCFLSDEFASFRLYEEGRGEVPRGPLVTPDVFTRGE
ncbi:MAG TPA: hypothetical protein DCP25_13070 [Chloroflexi bacterium]|nr:hypothetical protein [Chloroflexota bacterium]